MKIGVIGLHGKNFFLSHRKRQDKVSYLDACDVLMESFVFYFLFSDASCKSSHSRLAIMNGPMLLPSLLTMVTSLPQR